MASSLDALKQPITVMIFVIVTIFTAMLLRSDFLAPLPLLPNLLGNPSTYVTNRQTRVSYRGTSANGVEHFQNIFYAEDTSGSRRFAPPVPYSPPRGTVIDATAAGAWCPQGVGDAPLPWTSPITNVSENCLSLRIARPSGVSTSSKLPVLVWVHGGKNTEMLLSESQLKCIL